MSESGQAKLKVDFVVAVVAHYFHRAGEAATVKLVKELSSGKGLTPDDPPYLHIVKFMKSEDAAYVKAALEKAVRPKGRGSGVGVEP